MADASAMTDPPSLQPDVAARVDNGNLRADGGVDITPAMGMTFKTYGEACYYYKQYAQRTGFGAMVRNSYFDPPGVCLKLVLACSKCRKPPEAEFTTKTNCTASIRFKRKDDGLLHLINLKLEHNHPLNPGLKERCYTRLSRKAVPREELCHELLREEEDSRSFQKECEVSTERGYLKLGHGNNARISKFFMDMQLNGANFFYLADLDQEGRLRNVFWADPLSRTAYQYFGDVVAVDTSCFINRGDINLVLFLGVNHHCQPVLLGCGMISDDTTETFVWLFKAWLACMSGRAANAIITEQSKAIQDAISQVFPEVHHRFCIWDVARKLPEKIRGFGERDGIRNTFKKVAHDSLRAEEFEKHWRDMIENFGLQRSEWFNLLYENRHIWVPLFLKDTFWAGMCNSQCCRIMAKFFDGFVNSETSLGEFLEKYEPALQSKYEKEAQSDYDSFIKTRPLVSKFYMEEQLSKIYTSTMFWKFQDELKATMYCDVSLLGVDGMVSTFIVKESTFLDDGSEAELKEHEVIYHANEPQVQCICGLFEFQGILCRHALTVLKLQQVYEIPSRYIMSRWRKDYKGPHALARSSGDILADSLVERYGCLSMRCLHLVDMGVMSSEKYQLAVELIRQARKHLLDDSTMGDGQLKLVRLKSRLNEISKGHLLSQSGTSMTDKIVDSSQVKRRGRPAKNRNLPNAEDSSGASASGYQTNVHQVVMNDSRHGEHSVTQGGINLMEDANPNDPSFGGHFSGNIQQHSASQGGINLMEDANPNDPIFGSHFGGYTQHHVSNQTGIIQFNKVIQGHFGQQTTGNCLVPHKRSKNNQLSRGPPG